MIDTSINDAPLSEEWLRSVGFCWHQLDRQPHKHWLLWVGRLCGKNSGVDDLGVELAPAWFDNVHGERIGGEYGWHCWLRSDVAHRYSRFLHVRHLHTQRDLIRLYEGITGADWTPERHRFGTAMSHVQFEQLQREEQRLDRQMLREHPKWRGIEKDDTRGSALPEHYEAHEKARGH